MENYVNYHDQANTTDRIYYPAPISRKRPHWVMRLSWLLAINDSEGAIHALISEVYQALHGKQYRLAAMGIRAILEQVMIMKVGDSGSFGKNLEIFQKEGYISRIQQKAMQATLEVGHAAMHRGFAPSENDLNTAMDILEGVLAPIFSHEPEAEKLNRKVPKRGQSN